MNYRNLVKSSNIEFEVHDHVIKCGKVTWQIRNIATATVKKNIISFDDDEPYFGESEPSYDLNLSSLFSFWFFAWFFLYSYAYDNAYILFYALLGKNAYLFIFSPVFLVVGKGLYSSSIKKSAWSKRKNNFIEKWKIWNTIRQNPPVVYSLVLETNAGGDSKTLFYSFDESQITKAQQAIEKSMERKTVGNINFQIETVNVGGDENAINNFGSSIYNQAIRDV
ncbi:MAG: hypothetical protein WA080_01940 [Sulfuricurvum sp.]